MKAWRSVSLGWGGIFLLASLASGSPVVEEDFGFSGGCKKDSEQASSAEGGCKETESGTVWSVPSSVPMTYEEAGSYCAKLRNGHWRGWALPRLRDIERVAEAGIAVKHFRGRIHDFYWAQDYDSGDLKRTAALTSDDFADRKADETAFVICTRPGVTAGNGCREKEDEYFLTGDGGCLYKKNGVAYSKRHDKMLPLPAAKSHCERLVLNGFDDWTLPAKEELEAVAWEGGADKHFPSAMKGHYWSASAASQGSQSVIPTSNGGQFVVKTTKEYLVTVNLFEGKPGYIASRTVSTPYDAGGRSPIGYHVGSRAPWEAYRSNEAHPIEAHAYHVLCVRGVKR